MRALALEIKAEANALVQDFTYATNVTELTVLYSLITYMDTFLLKCIDDSDKVINSKWITMRLMEVEIILKVSRSYEVKEIVKNVIKLNDMIGEQKWLK